MTNPLNLPLADVTSPMLSKIYQTLTAKSDITQNNNIKSFVA